MLSGVVALYQGTGAFPAGSPPEESAKVLASLLSGFILHLPR
jgi:hypothetical protein